MNPVSLTRSLEAHHVFYANRLMPAVSPEQAFAYVKKQMIENAMREAETIGIRLGALEEDFGCKRGYNPNQPRVPSGNSDGGQWTRIGGVGGSGSVAKPGGGFISESPKPLPNGGIIPPKRPSLEDILLEILKVSRIKPPVLHATNQPNGPVYEGDPDLPLESVYPLEALIGLLSLGGLGVLRQIATGLLGVFDGIGGAAEDTEWTLGGHKSPQKWENQMNARDWTPEQITEAIKRGERFDAPNMPHPQNGATRYQLGDKFVVRDNVTKEILQVSRPGKFEPSTIPPK